MDNVETRSEETLWLSWSLVGCGSLQRVYVDGKMRDLWVLVFDFVPKLRLGVKKLYGFTGIWLCWVRRLIQMVIIFDPK